MNIRVHKLALIHNSEKPVLFVGTNSVKVLIPLLEIHMVFVVYLSEHRDL